MNSRRVPLYTLAPQDKNLLTEGVCPITGEKLGLGFIEFVVNDKKIRVCSHDCMVRIKNIYNYLR